MPSCKRLLSHPRSTLPAKVVHWLGVARWEQVFVAYSVKKLYVWQGVDRHAQVQGVAWAAHRVAHVFLGALCLVAPVS
jgi:hypothetical protein